MALEPFSLILSTKSLEEIVPSSTSRAAYISAIIARSASLNAVAKSFNNSFVLLYV